MDPTYGRVKAGQPALTYIQQLCKDTGCSPEDLPEAMNEKGEVAREGQGYLCWRHDIIMMMIYSMDTYLQTTGFEQSLYGRNQVENQDFEEIEIIEKI